MGMPGCPALSLRDTLNNRTVLTLRDLAKSYYVKGFSRMKKAALVESVYEAMLEAERLMEIAYVTDPESWTLFHTAATEGIAFAGPDAPPYYRLLVELGYLNSEETEQGAYLTMPDEIRALYADLVMGGLAEQKQQYDDIHSYAQAAANFYGAIPLMDFAALFNAENEAKTGVDGMLPALYRHISVDAAYRIWNDYLISEAYAEEPQKKVTALLEKTRDIPRYVPPREELLRYLEPSYFEATEYTAELEHYLIKRRRRKPEEVWEIMTLLHYACEIGASVPTALGILERYQIRLNEKQRVEMMERITQIFDTSRVARLHGHTAAEVREIRRTAPQKQKIGRNDPCPCGSGRKYKKCCGR